MPKRIIDGEGIWLSRRLKSVQPAGYRSEYAWLLPLALANGVFECDPGLVWAKCYAFNRPEISRTRVTHILDIFESAGLLFRWRDDQGKIWGYWINIDKPGRLPSLARQRERHELVGPAVPQDKLREFLHENANREPMDSSREPIGSLGLGFGLGLGSGLGIKPFAQPDEFQNPGANVVLELPLHDKSSFPIFDAQLARWSEQFPAVDVRQELHSMQAWCEANPTRRKTRTGILRFAASWLRKQQNGEHHGNPNGDRTRKPDALDVVRASRHMPDFGSGDVQADQPVAHRADKSSRQT